MNLNMYESFRDSWYPFIIAGVIGILTFIRSLIGGQECPSDNNIKNKVVLLTGASSGLGLQVTKELAKRGGTIILTCRNLDKGKEAEKLIKQQIPNAEIHLKELDVSSIKNIKKFVQSLNDFSKLDILINNAGIMLHPYEITDEDFETHFVTNYLGHFALIHLLLPKLKASNNGRIINVAAQAYAAGHINLEDINLTNVGSNNTIQAFAQSKLALVLMSRYMKTLLEDTNITINSVDPGLMRNTDHMQRTTLKSSIPVRLSVWPWMWLFLKTPKQGSQTVIYLAVDPKLSLISGKHFSNCEMKDLAENCKDEKVDEKLYNLSCTLTKIEQLNKDK